MADLERHHEWAFVAGGDCLVGVCGRCGLVRTSVIPGVTGERQFNVAGTCPEEPADDESLPMPVLGR